MSTAEDELSIERSQLPRTLTALPFPTDSLLRLVGFGLRRSRRLGSLLPFLQLLLLLSVLLLQLLPEHYERVA
jgi:hypothetical protein